jgi:hypothetical protein
LFTKLNKVFTYGIVETRWRLATARRLGVDGDGLRGSFN